MSSSDVGEFAGEFRDSTVGTWSTNFLISGVAVVCSGAVAMQASRAARDKRCETRAGILLAYIHIYFLAVATANILAGAGHLVCTDYDNQKPQCPAVAGTSYLFVALSSASLGNGSLETLLPNSACSWGNARAKALCAGIWTLLCIAAGVYSAVSVDLMITGFILVAALALQVVAYLQPLCSPPSKQRRRPWELAALAVSGTILILIGVIIQVVFSEECGSSGEMNYTFFPECPFGEYPPLNHNAVFHIFWAAGIGLQGILAAVHKPWVLVVSTDDLEADFPIGSASGSALSV